MLLAIRYASLLCQSIVTLLYSPVTLVILVSSWETVAEYYEVSSITLSLSLSVLMAIFQVNLG